MTIRLYNTLKNQKEDFIPVCEGKVGMYCCGPTTYNFIHLGNARPIVVFDTIRRYFMWRGYQVDYIQNFTDIDDKIINRGKEEGLSASDVANKYIAAYYEDAQALKVLPANFHPKVTEHIEEIIAMVEEIIAKGHGYVSQGDVYFDVASFPGYGSLSGRDLEDMQAGARVDVSEQKHNPLDFVLWKSAKPGEPAWDSPWGKGRPGWHIECSAMSNKYLGKTFDIHGGGADLVFPHHENEIAQSKAATGGDFAHYWLHNGFITVNQEKMSKSLGNFFLLRDILSKFPGDVVRYYLLATHYRSPIDFDDEKLSVAQKSLERIHNSWQIYTEAQKRAIPGEDETLVKLIAKARDEFIAAMDDDFNTALAFGVIFNFCRELNSYIQENPSPAQESLKAAGALFEDFHAVLGVIIPEAKEEGGLENELMEIIIKIRQSAREKKDWATADAIRDGLKEIGIVVEDTPQGARWKRV